jgi:hypothetical protein
MRGIASTFAILCLAAALSGCAVADVAGAAVDVGSTVVSTTADVAGDAVDTVTGDDSDADDTDKSDKKKDDGKGD